jgi:hypothetical protein
MACRFHALAGLVALLALASSQVCAAEGRVVFSGAVVEPTCAPAINGVPLPDAADASPAVRFGCGAGPARPASTGQVFARTVTRLAANESIPVLKYFSDYVAASQPGAMRPVLVTQTYE